MNRRKQSAVSKVLMATLLLSSAGGFAFAAERSPLTPELAAKQETVRRQQEQRVTPEKRKAAAEALKAERLKVHQAREAAKNPTPVTKDEK